MSGPGFELTTSDNLFTWNKKRFNLMLMRVHTVRHSETLFQLPQ